MAPLSRFPVATAPAAPVRERTGHLALRAYAGFILFVALTNSFWHNLLGSVGTFALILAAFITTLALWIPRLHPRRREERYPWRRLPWVAVIYTALTLLSLLWTQWPMTTLITAVMLASCTAHALFFADIFTWRELLRFVEGALAWAMWLSLAMELWVALIVRAPIVPNFLDVPDDPDPQWYWVRGNITDGFLSGGRIQGIVGNSNMLGILCLLTLVVCLMRLIDRTPGTIRRVATLALAAYLLVRAGSATIFVDLVVVAVALLAAVIIRMAPNRRSRGRRYILLFVLAGAGVAIAVLEAPFILRLLGRSGDLTGRLEIWSSVWERAITHPVLGNGFASPWLPWDPAFNGWILDKGITVFHAHEMWLDVFLQLGAVGVLLMAGLYLSVLWRTWFFAVDRPRWDLRADRPYRASSLIPVALPVMLLVQGLSESAPIMLWGWMLMVMVAAKAKTTPALTDAVEARTPPRTSSPSP